MTTRLKLKPGQRGTKRLVDKYGDALVCVRYRYDEANHLRLKTVEIVVEKKEWAPAAKIGVDDLVPVRIAYEENECREMARAAGGRWDAEARLWFIPYGKVRGTELEKHLILDTPQAGKKKKSI